MRKILLASVVAVALPVAAFAQSGGMAGPSGMTAPSMQEPSAGMAGSGKLSAQDKSFIKMAAISGLSEVTDGQLAESMGSDPIKQIGMRMVTDHSKANDQLAELSQRLGDPAPTQVDSKHAAMTASLQKESGGAFDSAYLKEQLAGHEKAISLFKKEISSGSNPELVSFAKTTLPVLEDHLSMIKSAMQS